MTQQTVHLAVYDTMSDWEISYAVAHINQPLWQHQPGRYQVRTVAETTEPVTTVGGVRVLPDTTLDAVGPQDSAMLLLPGAWLWDQGGNGAFAKKARAFLDAGVPVAAICGATYGLAAEGLLNERDHTSAAPEYVGAAAGYTGAERYHGDVVAYTDGDLITASPVGAVEFAREIFARLDLYTPEVLAAWYQLYGEQDPSGYPVLMAAGGQG